MTETYHHGDLPNALRHAAAELITEKGLGGFSLREVARRAGVSHAAPAHHFGDTTGLLTSLAVEAFTVLGDALEARAEMTSDPAERLTEIGKGYVSVAVSHPAHCEILFRADLVDVDNPNYIQASKRAHAVLVSTVEALSQAINPSLDQDAAVKLCWASMQGLVVLHAPMARIDEEAGKHPDAIDELIPKFTAILISGFTPQP